MNTTGDIVDKECLHLGVLNEGSVNNLTTVA
jgi:hypothetical protein